MENQRDWLATAEALVQELKNQLPHELKREDVSLNIPFKALALKQSLLHRANDLAEAACSLFRDERTIPGMILSRAVMETTALLYLLRKKMAAAMEQKNVDLVDDFLVRSLEGSHYFDDDLTPINVITAVGHVGKESEQFLDMYKWLSEHTHPNSLGADKAYSVYDEKKHHLQFGFNREEVSPIEGYISLVTALSQLQLTALQTDQMMPEFIAFCEAGLT